MLTPFMALAGALGLTGRAKAIAGAVIALVAFLVLVAIVVGLWSWWLSDRDDRVRQADRDQANVKTLETTVAADRKAGAAKADAEAAAADERARLERKADEAKHAGRSPLDAVADELRRQPPR